MERGGESGAEGKGRERDEAGWVKLELGIRMERERASGCDVTCPRSNEI